MQITRDNDNENFGGEMGGKSGMKFTRASKIFCKLWNFTLFEQQK